MIYTKGSEFAISQHMYTVTKTKPYKAGKVTLCNLVTFKRSDGTGRHHEVADYGLDALGAVATGRGK